MMQIHGSGGQHPDLARAWLDRVGMLRPVRSAKRRCEAYNLQLRALCGETLVPKEALTEVYRDALHLLSREADGQDTATPETARRPKIEHAGAIMIDCDIHPAAVESLTFCGPLIRDRAVIVFDDWHSQELAARNLGEKKACDEFLTSNPGLTASPLPSYCDNAAVFLVERRPLAEIASSNQAR